MALVVGIYAVLFMDWDTRGTPFDGVSCAIPPEVGSINGLRAN